MSISVFGYTLLAGVVVLTAYLVRVSSVEPPLELYRPPADGEDRVTDVSD